MSDTIFSREDRKRIALLVDLLRDYELLLDGLAHGSSPQLPVLAKLKVRTRAILTEVSK